MKTPLPSLPFAQETARRIVEFGERLHGLFTVRAEAQPDCTIALQVEFFANDTERDGMGDLERLFDHIADMGLIADGDMPLAVSGGVIAGQVIEHYLIQ